MSRQTSVTVPSDMLAISVLGGDALPALDGDDFRRDGYVYRKGVRARKWFTRLLDDNFRLWAPHLDFRLWAPHLDRPAWLEALAHRVEESEKRRYARIWKLLEQIRDRGGLAHARAPHQPDEGPRTKTHWLYQTGMYAFGGAEPSLSYTFEWVEAPEAPLLPELGADLFHLDFTLRSKRRPLVRRAALQAIQRKLRPLDSMSVGTIERVRVNGREYQFRVEGSRWGGKERTLLASGVDIVEPIDLGDGP